MNIEQDVKSLNENLSIQINGLLPPKFCSELITRYEGASDGDAQDTVVEEIIRTCAERAFTDDVNGLIKAHLQSGFEPVWPTFDVVDATDAAHNPNTFWHLDGGVRHTLKLFVYLNPVAEHGGNTPIIDLDRSNKLKKTGALPIEQDKRKQDMTEALEALGLDTTYLAYDLKAGDVLLFNPLVLAHRCQPPKEGQKRYTVCFTILPTG